MPREPIYRTFRDSNIFNEFETVIYLLKSQQRVHLNPKNSTKIRGTNINKKKKTVLPLQNKEKGKDKEGEGKGITKIKGNDKGKTTDKGIVKRNLITERSGVEKPKKRIFDESTDMAEGEYFCNVCVISYNTDTSESDLCKK